MSKIQIKTEEVTIYKPVPAKWSRVLLWLASFGKWGETFVIDTIPGKKYFTPPDHINCRCAMPPVVPPKDFVDIVSEEYSLVESTGYMFNGIMTPEGRDYLLVRTMDHNSNTLNTLYKWGTEEIVTISANSDMDYSCLAIDSIIRLKEVYND